MNSTQLHSEATNELYEMLSPGLRAELARSERSMIVPKGTALIQQGVLPEHLVIVNSGKVAVTLNCARRSASLDYSGAGKVFGMRAMVSGELPEINVTSLAPCSITTVPRDAFLVLLKSNPEIYFAVAKVLSTDLKIADRILRDNSRRFPGGNRSRPSKTV
ncbi:MAG TPA: Crp/Fnr family transcriptional regulator [Candidatus Dormibacteraeota bacterium]|nr:Crp/Fnr family transcriptional regulator [Candidatus Dormibacteraeota bacterium]